MPCYRAVFGLALLLSCSTANTSGSSTGDAKARSTEAGATSDAPPLGKLPADVRPTLYALSLEIDPRKERFSGTAEIAIELDRPRSFLWLHGADLHVTAATVEAVVRF